MGGVVTWPKRRSCRCWAVARVAAVLVLAAGHGQAVEIVAHRGASYDAPENTLPAVRLGWEQGADAVEIDIHQTRDGRIVAIHDQGTARVTGRRGVVAEMDFAQLRQLDAGAWKGERFRGTRVPALSEVLATVPPGKRLVVEIKCSSAVLEELERIVDQSGKRGQVMLIAFDWETIRSAKRRMPDVPAFWLYGFSSREVERYSVSRPEDLLVRVRRAGLDGLDVRHNGPWVAELAALLRAEGKQLYVYTVNSGEQARQLVEQGVHGLTTDRPAFLRDAIGAR